MAKTNFKFNGWKRKYAYLDDYKKGMDGRYVYYGRHHIFQGSADELRRYKWILGGMDFLTAAIFISSGLMDAGIVWRTWYSLLPYAFEALAAFILIWKTVSLIMEKHPVKSYIYRKTVPWFRPLGLILLFLSALSICTTGLCMILNPDWVKVTGCILYMVLQLVLTAGSLLFVKELKKYSWEEDPSEEVEQ